jgi:transposase InsO family protein
MRELTDTKAGEDDDIIEHLSRIKQLWDRITLVCQGDLPLSPKLFKKFLTYSLPPSWDEFTRQFSRDPLKKDLTVPQFIGECHEEFRRRQKRGTTSVESAYAAPNKPFAQRRGKGGKDQNKNKTRCTHCGRANHLVENCYHLSKPKCTFCKKLGHKEHECKSKKKSFKPHKDKLVADATASQSRDKTVANVADDMEIDGDETMAALDAELISNSDICDDMYLTNLAANEASRLYDWLADSGSTNHITNRRDIFSSYEPTPDATVQGVGNKIVKIVGRGTVLLTAQYGTRKRLLKLERVQYIPSNKYNIFALGRWDTQGRRYQAANGALVLYNKDDVPIVRGDKISSHLYKFKLLPANETDILDTKYYTFSCREPLQTWETWHRRFGHVSYDGLRKLHTKRLIQGFTVDPKTPTPDCTTCTQAKQMRKPFDYKSDKRRRSKGELTHMDLWGKYDVTSINGHQYYLMMVDDATRYVTVYFLKGKHEAAQYVKDYMTHLHVRGVITHGIRVDRGTEFVNKDLKDWCHAKGMEIELTAPYSPSQNGIAERMNRTLVELARAMIIGSHLPEYLWEHAVSHAAYIRNRSYTTAVSDQTPYEGWHGMKPNVTHLREFGAPVWVLLQGQNIARKIMPKSKRRAYIGYNDMSKSVLYYNAETRKVLASRNYVFLSAKDKEPPEEIVIQDTPTHEGEREDETARRVEENTQPKEPERPKEPDTSRKRKEQPSVDEPRKTRGVRQDYRRLADPFSDEESEGEKDVDLDDFDESQMYIAMAEAEDEFQTLKEAKESPSWPEWEIAIRAELVQHREKGTWELVDLPAGAIPLKNKWVFVLKRDKEGRIIRYKARLVVKGCGQRLGHDYLETHSPVVRMESIRAVLAIATAKRLLIQQMDVKGAYLNGKLKETIYMRQPDGFEDGTGRVCHLLRTLYGLKQSGREWNAEFDSKMRARGYKRSRADPCIYTRNDADKTAMITVWVDDLLLFADSKATMEEMKKDIRTEWETTDMGEPSKIVGIEIDQSYDAIKISQKKMIQGILERQGLADANTVNMPLDPTIKILPNPDGNEGSRSNSYAQLLGELQFIANSTRPDIAFAVNRLASYTANPSMQHQTALKRILRYLAGTRNHGITYKHTPDPVTFHGYADASYKNRDDGKSTSGYVFIAAGGAITWRSNKQTVTALSSTEAEYIALWESGKEASWLRNLYKDLGHTQVNPTTLISDSTGAISIARDPLFHKRTKHIDPRNHWIREKIQAGRFEADHCLSEDQTADVLTKALPRPLHEKHVHGMGLATV